MKIAVCIKQVPATNKVRVDEETGVLLREGVRSKMNPNDLYALETALQLKEQAGAHITAVTMGPPAAEAVVREAFLMGADEGYLLSDKRLGGADVLATSYTLYQAMQAIGEFDLIICGKQTTDGDTAQVGPAIAEYMRIPHAAWVTALSVIDNGIRVQQNLQEVVETVEMPFPCLITVETALNMPRLPSLKRAKEIGDKAVKRLTPDHFPDKDAKRYGLTGSATQVERIFPPPEGGERIVVSGDVCVQWLHQHLTDMKYINGEGA